MWGACLWGGPSENFNDFLSLSTFSMRILHPHRIFKVNTTLAPKFLKSHPNTLVVQKYNNTVVQQWLKSIIDSLLAPHPDLLSF